MWVMCFWLQYAYRGSVCCWKWSKIFLCVYVCVCVCMCARVRVCVCVCAGGGVGRRESRAALELEMRSMTPKESVVGWDFFVYCPFLVDGCIEPSHVWLKNLIWFEAINLAEIKILSLPIALHTKNHYRQFLLHPLLVLLLCLITGVDAQLEWAVYWPEWYAYTA